MRTQNEQYAYFTLHGDFVPDDVTLRLGVVPTQVWRKGERTSDRNHQRIFSRWSLSSRLAKDEPLELHIRDVFAQMAVNRSGFREMAEEYCGTMQLVGYFWIQYPGIHFEHDIVRELSNYSLGVDFDFYGLYSHRREDTGYTFEG